MNGVLFFIIFAIVMAIIPNDTQFIGDTTGIPIVERKSSKVNSSSQPYTMADIIETVGGSTVEPGGADTQIQFNDGGVFGGSANFTYNKSTGLLSANTVDTAIDIGNSFTINYPADSGVSLMKVNSNGNFQLGKSDENPTSINGISIIGSDLLGTLTLGSAMYERLELSHDGVLSVSNDAVWEFGSAIKRINKVYSVSFHGDGSALTNLPLHAIGSATQIPFTNATADDLQYSSEFVYTSSGLAVGVTTPNAKIHVKSDGIGTNSAVLIQNDTPTSIFTIKDNGEFSHIDITGAKYTLSHPSLSLNPRFHWNSGTGDGLFLDTLANANTFGFDGTVNFTRVIGINQDITNAPTLSLNSAWASAGFGIQAASSATENLFNFYSYRINTSTANAFNVGNASYANILTISEKGAVGIGTATPLPYTGFVNAGTLHINNTTNANLRFTVDTLESIIASTNSATFIGNKSNHELQLWTNGQGRIKISADGCIGVNVGHNTYGLLVYTPDITKPTFAVNAITSQTADLFQARASATVRVKIRANGVLNLNYNAIPTGLTTGDIYGNAGKLYHYNGSNSVLLADQSKGECFITTPAATTFSAALTPTKALGTTSTNALDGFVADSVFNRLKYTGTNGKTFTVIASISMTAASTNKNYNFYAYFFDSSAGSGSILTRSKVSRKIGTGTDKGALSVSCNVSMDANDYIEIWVECVEDTSAITLETMNFTVH